MRGKKRVDKINLGNDVQKSIPSTQVALSRVGVTKLRRILRLNGGGGNGRETLFFAEMDLFVHLDAKQAGVHMSRFIENIEDIASEMFKAASPSCESLAERMAIAMARTQGASRSEVRIRAQYPMTKRAPVSGIEVEDIYTFIGYAVSDGESTRRAVGVEVNGLTVCPCAQEMTAEYSRELLMKSGYSKEQADEITSILPLASHNQRGRGTLIIGTETAIHAAELVSIIESSMSSEIYELLKRPDELHVVKKAHHKTHFVEDVVREMIRGVTESLPGLPEDAFIFACQENFESIHVHNASAERCGLLGGMRCELAGGQNDARDFSSLEAWLENLL